MIQDRANRAMANLSRGLSKVRFCPFFGKGTRCLFLALFRPDGSNWRCPFIRAKRTSWAQSSIRQGIKAS